MGCGSSNIASQVIDTAAAFRSYKCWEYELALTNNAEYSLDLTRYEVKARSAPEESMKTIDYAALARGLKANKSMDELILSKNNMTADDLKTISDALSGVSHLSILTLSINSIGDEGVNSLFAAIADDKNKSESNNLLSSLLTLDLGSTEITDAGLEKFFSAVSMQSKPLPLTTLILTNNSLTDASMATLAKHLDKLPNLRSFAVSGNAGITDAGTTAVGEAVQAFTAGSLALREVAVSGCAAGEDAISKLRAVLNGASESAQGHVEQARSEADEARSDVEQAIDAANEAVEGAVAGADEDKDRVATEAQDAAKEAQEHLAGALDEAREQTEAAAAAVRAEAQSMGDDAREETQEQAHAAAGEAAEAASGAVASANDAAVDAIDAAIEAMADATEAVAAATEADADAQKME